MGVLDRLVPPAFLIGNVCEDLTGAGLFVVLSVLTLAAVELVGENFLPPSGTRQIGVAGVAPGIGNVCDGLTISRFVEDRAAPLLEVKDGGFLGTGGAFL